MYSIPSYYELGSCSNSVNYLQGVLSSSRSRPTTTTMTNTNNMGNYSSTSISMLVSSKSQPPPPPPPAEEKAAAASKSHSEAERRRRKRINGHLATLRSLLPNTIKTDKASLLAEVVRRLRELKKTTAEELAVSGGGSNNSSSSSSTISSDTTSESSQSRRGGGGCGGAQPPTPKQHNMLFPSEADELKLCYSEGDSSTASTIIKATLCCEDRPELMSDMTRAVRSVEGKVVRAEMATVGGRTKSILWVQLSVSGSTAAGGGDGGGGDEGGGIGRLRRALKVVLDKNALPTGWGLQALPENKRPRLSQY